MGICQNEFNMHKSKTSIKDNFIICTLLTLIFIHNQPIKAEAGNMRFNEVRLLMGTEVEVIVIHENEGIARKAISDAFSAMERVDRLMSNFKESSDISRVNRGAGIEDVTVDRDVIGVIEKSLYYSELSDGAFDVTIGGAEELYHFEDKGNIPEEDKFKNSISSIGYKNIKIKGNTVRLLKRGTKIDLGGIAAGYAVDKGIEAIKKTGIHNALINAGGDIRTIGESDSGQWKVGILHPRKEDKLINTLSLKNLSVATSGDYRKYFISHGKRYHHILNPVTGLPVEGVQNVTILAPLAIDADAISTAVFVMGKERGMALIEKLKDVEGIIIDSHGVVTYSSGIKNFILQ